ncbi:MFS transporter [Corynebacterium epidermidicanis]|uniref:Major facilitator superfamily permease n=1 Tax=Corynebacterium epidermidicanis TaxID=1050174 RepID=A0A0G3GYJ9_9CORY|nr:MFS transporter [Corynebacterium epidermidicanis]AKK03942.1 major facilitator superfamily permease [Corynebacterium epidermidicanis]
MHSALTHRTDRGTVTAWALWDWGSSAFNAVLVTFVFSVYLKDSVGASIPDAAAHYGFAMAAAGILIAVIAPVQGRRTDVKGHRRRAVRVWTLVTVCLMASLFFVRNDAPWYFYLGCTIMAVASVTFQFAEVPYFAMLAQVSTKQTVGRVSGYGWAAGYFGGIFLLLICFVGFISGSGETRGLLGLPIEGGLNIRLVAVLAAVWLLVFGLPVMFRVPEIPADPKAARQSFTQAYRNLFSEVAQLWRTDRNSVFFLLASAVFRDGLAGVFTFGAILAVSVYGISASDVLLFGVAANVVSALGAVLAGYLDDIIGPKPVIVVSLLCMILDCAVLYLVSGATMFWIFGLILCLFVGPAQSAARTFLTRVSPPRREGQMFGLYATTGRAVSWLAPGAFAIFVALFDADRAGIIGIGLILLLGCLLMLSVASPRK